MTSSTSSDDAMAPVTPYLMMRVGRVPMVAYHPPGSDALAEAVRAKADVHRAVLMANHGFVMTSSIPVDISPERETMRANTQ